mmetsp:Transcript_22705/g.38888  ORF Transcript_22705/g.38888 Transcript_22705/m.38888 type:complete len:140 (-) Transcript_22705:752-1171(-)
MSVSIDFPIYLMIHIYNDSLPLVNNHRSLPSSYTHSNLYAQHNISTTLVCTHSQHPLSPTVVPAVLQFKHFFVAFFDVLSNPLSETVRQIASCHRMRYKCLGCFRYVEELFALPVHLMIFRNLVQIHLNQFRIRVSRRR